MDWESLGEISLLVVDDDPFTRELIFMMLKKVKTIKLHELRSAEEALIFFENKANKVDMILLDYYMPGMNGHEFIQILKKEQFFQEVPIALITTDRLSKRELNDIGADYYLTKPFDFSKFLFQIYSFLKNASNES